MCVELKFSFESVDMVSTNNPWHALHEQLMRIDDNIMPSAPIRKDENSSDNHWIELDFDILIGDKFGCSISIMNLNNSIMITHVRNSDGLLRPFDTILLFNDINFENLTKETAEYIVHAYQGKHIRIRIRRLQPTNIEMVQVNFKDEWSLTSSKLGLLIDGGIQKRDRIDPGLFIVGIKPNSYAAKTGRLRIGDRLMQISNYHTTINLQCMDFHYALKLIERMRKESNTIILVVAHQTQN